MTRSSAYTVYGLGPIGLEILRGVFQNDPDSLIGVVDINPNLTGKDVGTLLNIEKWGIEVVPHIQKVNSCFNRPVALHATGSNAERVWPQIKELLDHGYSVVSTCEQLSFPWRRYPSLSTEIDSYAKEKGLSVIGTGINPGFIMDTLAICFSTVMTSIRKISIRRTVDVSKRRIPLQQKVGIGMSKERFEQLAAREHIGHVGLEESLRMIAYSIQWAIDDVSNFIEPTLAEEEMTIPLTNLSRGDVNGLHQRSQGKTADGKEIILDLTMSVGVKQEDEIIIEGDGTQRLLVPGGIFGDTATAAMVINTAKQINAVSKPGLLTMADIGIPRNINQPKE